MKLVILIALFFGSISFVPKTSFSQNPNFITFTANPKKDSIKFFYKNKSGEKYNTFESIKNQISGQLVFAMNGGMFLDDFSPCGLYVENGKLIRNLNKFAKSGVFYVTKSGKAGVCSETDVPDIGAIRYATQSLPVLLSGGKINPKFKEESSSVYVRNGVGILPNGEIVFVITTSPVNLYQFARHFKESGCISALYLDGDISEMYYPEKQMTTSYGNFGVIIGIVK